MVKIYRLNIIKNSLTKTKIPYFISILLVLCIHTTAQNISITDSTNVQGIKSDSAFKFLKTIPGSYSYLDVDVLDNIYLITETNQLKKIKPNGDSLAVFNDVKKFGNPTLLDVSNPLKILLYYKNFSTVIILDRFLAVRNTINFRNQNIFKIKTLANSYDNNIWIFDEQNISLKKINDEGNVLSETLDLRQLFDTVPSPNQIIDKNNFVYLYDENRGFFIFDYYGSFKNNLPFLNWKHIAVYGNKIMGFVGDTFYSYELNSINLKSYKLPVFFKDYIDIKTMNGKIYLLKKDGVEIFDLR